MLFDTCTAAERAQIDSLTTPLRVAAGRTLCREGEVGREFFIIDEGEAAVTIGGVEVAVLGPDDFFGELSLLDIAPRNATVTSLTPMRLLVLNRAEFASLLDASPMIARRILRVVGPRLRSGDGRRVPQRDRVAR